MTARDPRILPGRDRLTTAANGALLEVDHPKQYFPVDDALALRDAAARPDRLRDPLPAATSRAPGLAFAVAFAVPFARFIPDGGIGEVYAATLGYQASEATPFSI